MQANTKTDATREQPKTAAPVSLVSELARQGVDGALATQRIMLDLIMRQNATTMNALRQTLSTARVPKADGVTDMAVEGVSNFIEAHRVLLNTAMQENEIVMSAVKDRGASPMLADLLRRSIDTFLELQQNFLSLAEKQTTAWMDQGRGGNTSPGKGMAEVLEDGLEQFVRSQRRLLDLLSEEMANKGESRKSQAKKAPAVAFTDVIGQSAGALVQMQKKLLDVAGKQVDVNLKVARRAMEALKPSVSISPADLARQYAENMVAAQKAMLELVVKPKPAAPRAQTKTQKTTTKKRARTKAAGATQKSATTK